MATAQPISYRRVYVWELPVRIFHWINATAILVLMVSGFLIGNPQVLMRSNEAYMQYWFGWTRFLHFAAGYIVFFNFFFRFYWGFVGNQFARWTGFFPVNKEQLRDMWETVRIDILQLKLKGKISIGHNYLASLTYVGLFLVFLFQVISGFGLYASMSDSFIPKLFVWIIPLMGGDANVRAWHHMFMWAFAVFSVIHIYLVFYHDYVEGRGDMSSMLGGWKFEKDDELNR